MSRSVSLPTLHSYAKNFVKLLPRNDLSLPRASGTVSAQGFSPVSVEAGKTSKVTENDGDIDAENKTLPGTGLTDEPCSWTKPLQRERSR